ncbi:MAG TPA: ABC transporter permease [Cyclobacteriaceae bacterium]|nr:ABC transporter permease [Cyclobacteriaceae bacterium]
MIRSFFVLAIRNFKRQFIYSAINVTGLAIGIACSLIILIYVSRELSYEKHFKSYEQVYRVGTKFMTMGEFANGPLVLLEVLPKTYPWIENTCRVKGNDGVELTKGEFTTKESGLFVESTFFELFPYSFESGSGNISGNGIVLDSKLAKKIFDGTDPIGKAVNLKTEEKVRMYFVKGVVNTESVNSHLNAPFWALSDPLVQPDLNWFMIDEYNYIKVKPNTDLATVQAAMDKIVETEVFPALGSTLSFEEWFNRDDAFGLIAQPVQDIYLKGTLKFDLTSGGNETMVYLLLVVALLILCIAAVNFINLSTARSIKRGKEVGIKKVIGLSRLQLATQFISESILMSLMAMMLALGLAELILLGAERFTGLVLLSSIFSKPSHLMLAFLLSLVLGLLSGIYPAMALSSFKPADVLKSSFKGRTNATFRNVLVVFQFGLSTLLIIGTLVIFRQLQFMSAKDLGFQQDNILIIDNAGLLDKNVNAFKESLNNYPGVISSSLVNRLPVATNSFSIESISSQYIDEPLKINRFQGDFDYPATLGFQLVSGRFYNPLLSSDSNAVILNESAVRAFQLGNPIGEVLNKKYEVIGVVKDFNYETLKKVIAPSMISFSSEGYSMAIRLESNNVKNILTHLESEWASQSLNEPMRFHFLDQNFANLMKDDLIMGEVMALFTLLAIFIACLGLFGLSAYMATHRKKEMGIRKVLGASVLSVLTLFGKEYSKLILISFLLAIPLSVFILQKWLSGFAYRVEIEWWVIVSTGLAVLIISGLTVGYHSLKTSFINPAETLRNE